MAIYPSHNNQTAKGEKTVSHLNREKIDHCKKRVRIRNGEIGTQECSTMGDTARFAKGGSIC